MDEKAKLALIPSNFLADKDATTLDKYLLISIDYLQISLENTILIFIV